MVRINLTWLFAAFAAVFAVLWLMTLSARAALEETRTAHAKTLQSVERIERLKKEWEQNPAARGRVESLFNEERFKRLGGTVQKTPAGFKAEFKGLDATLVNALSRQLLQAPVPVKSLQMERRGDQAVDLVLEVAL